MAPEQCAGNRSIDGRADIYSLGTVLYRCVVGRLPYSGSTTQVLHAHVYAPLTIDNTILQQLSPQIVTILKRSLAKASTDRYATAYDLAHDLAAAAGRRLEQPQSDSPAPKAEATATLTLASLPATAVPQAAGQTHCSDRDRWPDAVDRRCAVGAGPQPDRLCQIPRIFLT